MQQNKLDKSQLIGFILIGFILIGFLFYSNKQSKEAVAEAKVEEQQIVQKDIAAGANEGTSPIQQISDSTAKQIELLPLQNEELEIKVSTLGAQLKEVRLKKWTAYEKDDKSHKKPLYLINNNNSDFNISFKDKQGRVINTKDLIFTPTQKGDQLLLTANLNEGASIQFQYGIKGKYSLDFSVVTQGLSKIAANSSTPAELSWEQKALALEKGKSQETMYTEFRYSLNNYDQTDYDTNGFEEDKDKLDWISVKQQFFATILEAKEGFTQSKGTQETTKDNPEYLKEFAFTTIVPLKQGEINHEYTWNFLPLNYDLLKSYTAEVNGKEESKQFSYNIPYGWMTWLCIFYLWLYEFFAGYGVPAGWIIFIMTIVVKLVTSPIMYKQYIQGAKMRVLKPEMDELNEKFKNADAMKKQQATMELYRKTGVNPFAGCLPALIQIPIFYSLFRFFPNNIAMRGESFWWADDLTAYDAIYEWEAQIPFLSSIYGNHISLFTILYCAVLLIYTRMSTSTMQPPKQEGMLYENCLLSSLPLTSAVYDFNKS